ncbi:Uncharacterized protein dnm_008370 [Desulfonema magnum]|uniref:Uncharacterized protein n=1 Tax=Desulfonema magnum TaxID=45655 RepID=A0A975GKL0_9BACT|nr:Uncharacterized protein dnm_008370 [Desulfonema magnum]
MPNCKFGTPDGYCQTASSALRMDIAKLQVRHSGWILPNCKFGTPDGYCQTASSALRMDIAKLQVRHSGWILPNCKFGTPDVRLLFSEFRHPLY